MANANVKKLAQYMSLQHPAAKEDFDRIYNNWRIGLITDGTAVNRMLETAIDERYRETRREHVRGTEMV